MNLLHHQFWASRTPLRAKLLILLNYREPPDVSDLQKSSDSISDLGGLELLRELYGACAASKNKREHSSMCRSQEKTYSKQQGFSLIELLAVITIFSVIGLVAVPQFGTLRGSMDRVNARSYILQDLKRAQAESITEGCRGIFKVAADNESYSFGCDYLDYDVAADPSADVSSFVRNMPTDITIVADSFVIFNSRGQAIDVSYALTNVNISIRDNGTEFASGILSAAGVFSIN